MADPTLTREQWLNAATALLVPVFKDRTGLNLPPVHASVGWPSRGGTSAKKRVIGQCWHSATSADGVAHIFISPMLGDSFDVLATLTHELVHALHPEAGHKGDFIASSKELGLVRPWTATTAGENLEPVLTRIINELGEFPHAKLTPISKAQKPQTTRQLKAMCPDDGYTIRVTQKWLDIGLPTCPCGTEMERA